MGDPKYYYNPDTCQYEPVKLRWTSVLSYSILLVVSSFVLWVSILLMYGRIFPSERQTFLKRENAALTNHYASLESELIYSAKLLKQLDGEEKLLYKKLFSESEPTEIVRHDQDITEAFVSSNSRKFRSNLARVSGRFNDLKSRSINANIIFGNNITITDKELNLFNSLPALPPVELKYVTNISGFGQRVNPFHKGVYEHPGADFAAARGTVVAAAAKGRVVNVSRSSIQAGYGNYIEIDHGNEIVTLYAHLDEINVRVGQRIDKGGKIGTVGSSGGSIAPHLHFEIFRKGAQVDPVPYLMQGLSSSDYALLQKSGSKKNQSLD